MRLLRLLFLLLAASPARAAEVIPPAPTQHLNDYANILSPATRQQLDRQLLDLETADSSQVVVAIFPKMQSDSSIEEYANRVFRAWGVGQKNKNNGVVLFVFVQDRKLRIEVGYGLEGTLPDALAKRIIEERITPSFRSGDFNAGITAGVAGIIEAIHGEFRAAPHPAAGPRPQPVQTLFAVLLPLIFFIVVAIVLVRRGRGLLYSGVGSGWSGSGISWGGGGGGWSSSGSGGGFSGGGGSSGGGGASGSW